MQDYLREYPALHFIQDKHNNISALVNMSIFEFLAGLVVAIQKVK